MGESGAWAWDVPGRGGGESLPTWPESPVRAASGPLAVLPLSRPFHVYSFLCGLDFSLQSGILPHGGGQTTWAAVFRMHSGSGVSF